MGQVLSFGILNRGSGLRPLGFTWQVTSQARLAGDVIQVWINNSPSNHCISHFKAQLALSFFIQNLICMYWIKGILGMTAWPYRVTTKYSYCMVYLYRYHFNLLFELKYSMQIYCYGDVNLLTETNNCLSVICLHWKTSELTFPRI